MTCPRGVRQGCGMRRALWSRPAGVTWHYVISATFGAARPMSLCEISQSDSCRSRLGQCLAYLEQTHLEVWRGGQRVGARQVMTVLVNKDISDYGRALDAAADHRVHVDQRNRARGRF